MDIDNDRMISVLLEVRQQDQTSMVSVAKQLAMKTHCHRKQLPPPSILSKTKVLKITSQAV